MGRYQRYRQEGMTGRVYTKWMVRGNTEGQIGSTQNGNNGINTEGQVGSTQNGNNGENTLEEQKRGLGLQHKMLTPNNTQTLTRTKTRLTQVTPGKKG